MEDTESLGSLPNASKKVDEGSQRKTQLLGQKLSLKSDERSEESMKIVKQDPVAGHFPSTAGSRSPSHMTLKLLDGRPGGGYSPHDPTGTSNRVITGELKLVSA